MFPLCIFLSILFHCTSSLINADNITSAITYESSGGRFGDNIRAFTQAYWEAYKHNLPLLYIPFPDSEKLMR